MTRPLQLADALLAADAGGDLSTELNVPIALAVLDAGARTVLVHRPDGVSLAETDMAQAKARAAALFARPSDYLVGGTGTPSCRQIPRAVGPLISRCRGTVVLAPDWAFSQSSCFAACRNKRQP